MSKRTILVTAISLLAFFTLACDIPALWGEGEDDHVEQRMRMESAAEGESTDSPPQDEFYSTDANPEGLPQIVLSYSETPSTNLPAYHASLSHPILVEETVLVDSVASAHQSARRIEDALELGSLQPGTVTQTSTFDGTWDPVAGVLTGTVTHTISATHEAAGEYLASSFVYSMSGTLEARLVEGTRRIEGTVKGPDALGTTTPEGSSSGPSTVVYPVDWIVSGELPDGI